MRVDLPHPDGPINAVTLRAGMLSEIFLAHGSHHRIDLGYLLQVYSCYLAFI